MYTYFIDHIAIRFPNNVSWYQFCHIIILPEDLTWNYLDLNLYSLPNLRGIVEFKKKYNRISTLSVFFFVFFFYQTSKYNQNMSTVMRIPVLVKYKSHREAISKYCKYSLKMSLVMRKPTFCICETKDADQLRGNREADQRLCFRNIDSTIPLLSKSEISSL